MVSSLKELVARRRSKAAVRRKAELEKAAREMSIRETDGGSIWKSGKGGGHHTACESTPASYRPPSFRYRKQVVTWSFTRPQACMNA